VSLINENGRLKIRQLRDGGACLAFAHRELTDLQSDAREQQTREHGLAGQHAFVEKSGGPGAEVASFEVTAFMKKKKSLVEIEEPGPYEIFFASEHFASFGEKLQGLQGFALLTVGDGFVGQGLGGFITHA